MAGITHNWRDFKGLIYPCIISEDDRPFHVYSKSMYPYKTYTDITSQSKTMHMILNLKSFSCGLHASNEITKLLSDLDNRFSSLFDL